MASNFKLFKYVLSGEAGITMQTPQSRFVRVGRSDHPILVTPDNQNTIELETGVGVEFDEPFNTLRIRNRDDRDSNRVEIFVGAGTVLDSRTRYGSINRDAAIHTIMVPAGPTVADEVEIGDVSLGTRTKIIISVLLQSQTTVGTQAKGISLYMWRDGSRNGPFVMWEGDVLELEYAGKISAINNEDVASSLRVHTQAIEIFQ